MKNIDKFIFPSLHKDVLLKYKTEDIYTFIESGTFNGRSVQLALECNFTKIISVEISKENFEYTYDRFRENKNVNIIHGDSYVEFPNICKNLNNRSIFWLDGHFDKFSDTLGFLKCPVLKELESISSSHIKNHIIMIDDMRVFGNANHCDWGENIQINDIIQCIKNINLNYKISYESGCIDNDVLIAYF